MTRAAASLVVVACSVAILASGCESTQTKSARLAREAKKTVAEAGLKLGRRNADVRVVRTAVVGDRYGTAAAVEVRSIAAKAQVVVPLAIAVDDASGEAVFTNTGAGLASSLNHVPALRPGERIWWVNDQIGAERAKTAKKVTAKVGTPDRPPPAALPRLVVGRLKLRTDPDGLYTGGKVRNRSKIDQLELILFGVARRGGKVVAAGRAGIERLRAGRTATFKVFWIGNPRGATVEVAAPPSTLR